MDLYYRSLSYNNLNLGVSRNSMMIRKPFIPRGSYATTPGLYELASTCIVRAPEAEEKKVQTLNIESMVTAPAIVESTAVTPNMVENEEKLYNYKSCRQKLSSVQGLGGHQHAHRFQKSLEECRTVKQEAPITPRNAGTYPYRSTSNQNHHLGNLRNSIMIHKPFVVNSHATASGFYSRYGHLHHFEQLRSRPAINVSSPSFNNMPHVKAMEGCEWARKTFGIAALGAPSSASVNVGYGRDQKSPSANQQPESPELDLALRL